MRPQRHMSALVAASVFAVALSACGSVAPRRTVVRLDPIEIKHRMTPSGRKVYVRDFDTLFARAMAHYKAQRYAEAVELWNILLAEFPEHDELGAVHFNTGLCLIGLRRYRDAIPHFREAIRYAAGTRAARDAVFYLAECHDYAGEHRMAAAVYQAALNDPEVIRLIGGELGVLDRLEASTRAGIALVRAGRPQRADRQLRAVERLYQDRRDVRLVAESEWVARAWYERGEIYRTLFESIRFKLPVERMQKELEDKAQLFLKAQSVYFRAVRLHHKKWSLAAGFRVGALYSRLIDDIHNAEVPPNLDRDTVAAYQDELWKHTRTLANKAIVVFRKNIDLARRLGRGGEWVGRSKAQLERMERLIAAQQARSRQYNAPAGAEPVDPKAPLDQDPARRRKSGGR